MKAPFSDILKAIAAMFEHGKEPPHTKMYFPVGQSYWPLLTEKEIADAVVGLKRTSELFPGAEWIWVTEPDQFTGVKFDAARIPLPKGCSEDELKALVDHFHQESVRHYKVMHAAFSAER